MKKLIIYSSIFYILTAGWFYYLFTVEMEKQQKWVEERNRITREACGYEEVKELLDAYEFNLEIQGMIIDDKIVRLDTLMDSAFTAMMKKIYDKEVSFKIGLK